MVEVADSTFADKSMPRAGTATITAGAEGVGEVGARIRLAVDGMGVEGIVGVAVEGSSPFVVVVAARVGALAAGFEAAPEIATGTAAVSGIATEGCAADPRPLTAGVPTAIETAEVASSVGPVTASMIAIPVGTTTAAGAGMAGVASPMGPVRLTGAVAGKAGENAAVVKGTAELAGAAGATGPAPSVPMAVEEGASIAAGAVAAGAAKTAASLSGTSDAEAGIADMVIVENAVVSLPALETVEGAWTVAWSEMMAEGVTTVSASLKRTPTDTPGEAGKEGPIMAAPIGSVAETGTAIGDKTTAEGSEAATVATTGGVAGMTAVATVSVIVVVGVLANPLAPSRIDAVVAEGAGAAATTDTASPPPASRAASDVGIADEAGSLRGNSTAMG